MKKWLRISLLFLLATGIIWALFHQNLFNLEDIQSWLEHSDHAAAPFIFMLVYILACILMLPGTPLTLLAGALFGPWWGTLYTLTGATLGATFAFLMSRYLISDWARNKMGKRLGKIIEGVEAEGWRFIAFARLVPFFPFNLLNYALGLTKIPLWHYFVTSYICMIPGGFAYAYLGYAGKEAAVGNENLIHTSLLALGLFALVLFLPRFIMRFKNR